MFVFQEPKLATEIMYRLKGKQVSKSEKICQSLNCYFQVLVDLTGKDQNVILFSPPMCFTMENGRVFTKCLDEVLASTSNRWKILSKLFQFLNIPGHPISPHSKGSATRQLLWSWQTHWEWGNGRSWKRPSGRKELGWRPRWRRRVTKRWTRTFIKSGAFYIVLWSQNGDEELWGDEQEEWYASCSKTE